MVLNRVKLVSLQRKVLFGILAGLVLFPFRIIMSSAHTIKNPLYLGQNNHNLLPVVEIDYLQKAQVQIQGKDFSDIVANKSLTTQPDREITSNQPEESTGLSLPKIDYRVRQEVVATVTAYNPVPEQTDSSPCVTANGTNICEQEMSVIAANWLPFGTKVQIPDYFGDKVFEVHDRMNARYNDRVDVLMYDLSEAKKFGRRQLRIVVLD